jgi:UDP-glucose 4-epimerase
MKTALVTGGAGFVGSHLCERLVAEGYSVISLDNYFTGSRENHVAGVEYREGHTKDIQTLIPETPDIVYHLGEYSRVAKSLEEPEVVWDLNMDGTFGVLEFWRKKKCRLVYAGSSTKFVEAREDGVMGRDLSPYTWAKAVNSELVVNYARWYDLSYVIVYFYNVYGPRERGGIESYGTVVETFRQNYLHNEPFKVRGTGMQTRAFTHVEDTVSAIMLASEKGENEEYGICANETHSLLDLTKMFGGEVVFIPAVKSTRSTEAVDASKIISLGWRQQYTLAQYIEELKAEKK